MIVMTTDSVRRNERVEYWADLISRNVTPMRMEPSGGQPLRGQIRAQVIGDLTVAEITVVGMHALHTRAEVANTRDHLYAACVQLEGEDRINHRGEQIELQKGDVFLTDSRHEYTLDLDRPGRRLAVSLPTRWLDSRVARPELLSGTVLHDHPLGRLWASHLATGFMIARDFSPSGAQLFARHSLELLVQALEEAHCSKPTPSEAARSATFLRACHLIGLKFGNPNLAPDNIASDLGVSTRTLTRIFDAHNETIMRRVFDERIRQAAKLLIAPEAAHRSVTEIAFACGFNDLSHFGRVFAAAIHMTPSQWRRRRN